MGSAWQEGGEAREEFSEKVMYFKAEEWGKDSQGERERKLIVYIFIIAWGGRSQETKFVVWESPVTALEYVSGFLYLKNQNWRESSRFLLWPVIHVNYYMIRRPSDHSVCHVWSCHHPSPDSSCSRELCVESCQAGQREPDSGSSAGLTSLPAHPHPHPHPSPLGSLATFPPFLEDKMVLFLFKVDLFTWSPYLLAEILWYTASPVNPVSNPDLQILSSPSLPHRRDQLSPQQTHSDLFLKLKYRINISSQWTSFFHFLVTTPYLSHPLSLYLPLPCLSLPLIKIQN